MFLYKEFLKKHKKDNCHKYAGKIVILMKGYFLFYENFFKIGFDIPLGGANRGVTLPVFFSLRPPRMKTK